MKYLIVGTGGTGGAIGGFLAAAGKEVDFIARGNHLKTIQKNGLRVHSAKRGDLLISPAHAFTMEEYSGSPDVIFLCVKGYSLEDSVPFLKKTAKLGCVVIPVLNIYGVGGLLAAQLPETTVPDGCMYVVSYISSPGEIMQTSPLVRVVYGMRDGENPEVLHKIASDLQESGIETLVSSQINRDCFLKFSCVSAMAAAGAYYNADMGMIRSDAIMRETFSELVREISSLADAMEIPFQVDAVKENLKILDGLSPDSTASLQKDLKKGGSSEIDGLLFEAVRLGKSYGVPVPTYEKIARHFGFAGTEEK